MWRSWSSSVRSSINAATSGGGPSTMHGCVSSTDGSLSLVFVKCHLQEWDCHPVLGASRSAFAGKDVLKRGNFQRVLAKCEFRTVLFRRVVVVYSRRDATPRRGEFCGVEAGTRNCRLAVSFGCGSFATEKSCWVSQGYRRTGIGDVEDAAHWHLCQTRRSLACLGTGCLTTHDSRSCPPTFGRSRPEDALA